MKHAMLISALLLAGCASAPQQPDTRVVLEGERIIRDSQINRYTCKTGPMVCKAVSASRTPQRLCHCR